MCRLGSFEHVFREKQPHAVSLFSTAEKHLRPLTLRWSSPSVRLRDMQLLPNGWIDIQWYQKVSGRLNHSKPHWIKYQNIEASVFCAQMLLEQTNIPESVMCYGNF